MESYQGTPLGRLGQMMRRKVAQWAVAYLALPWSAIQVFDPLGAQFGWPASCCVA